MIELRWVWHDFTEHGETPPAGAIQKGGVNSSLYQKLQYRTRNLRETTLSDSICVEGEWSEWKDVPHHGLITKDKEA